VGLLPSLGTLSDKEKSTFIRDAQVFDVPEGSTILRHGETGDTAYFILAGKTVAGLAAESGNYRSLSTMIPGDFFGEIAALTGVSRTADVVATESTSLLQVPANSLRSLMGSPILSNLFLSKMAERLGRTSLSELPRIGGIDQKDAQALRSVVPEK
jgi:CRP-like cAMP-binding protein